jgi:hypothetical protein
MHISNRIIKSNEVKIIIAIDIETVIWRLSRTFKMVSLVHYVVWNTVVHMKLYFILGETCKI